MSALQKQNYSLVKSKYEQLREDSRIAASEGLPAVLPNKRGGAILTKEISFEEISLNAEKELKSWERSNTRRVAWNWEEVRGKYRAQPKRFELSIWYRRKSLCGVSIGKLTRSGGKLRLDYLEASPMGTKLDGLVTDLSITAAIFYARAIGASQLRIMNPVNESVRNYYASKPGFSYDKKGDFCYRDLT